MTVACKDNDNMIMKLLTVMIMKLMSVMIMIIL